MNLVAIVALMTALLSSVPVSDHSFERSVLTNEGARYSYLGDTGEVTISAPKRSTDSNRREVFRRPAAPVIRNQTTCATWASQSSDMVQEGLAVRIREGRDRTRAITLTKNTIFGVHWTFNLLTWDTARRREPWRALGQYDMSAAVVRSSGHLYRLPWRACLRATGHRVAFKVWPLGRVPRPGWHDPTYSRQTRIPRSFDAPGRPGWYVGHVPPGGHVVYRNLTATR